MSGGSVTITWTFFSSPSLNLFSPDSNTRTWAIEALRLITFLVCCLYSARAVLPVPPLQRGTKQSVLWTIQLKDLKTANRFESAENSSCYLASRNFWKKFGTALNYKAPLQGSILGMCLWCTGSWGLRDYLTSRLSNPHTAPPPTLCKLL